MLGAAELRFEVHMQRLPDRQLSVMQGVSQSAHFSTGMAMLCVSVKSIQECLILNIYTEASALCGPDGQNTDKTRPVSVPNT